MPKTLQNLFLRSLIAVAVCFMLPFTAAAEAPTITVTQLDGSQVSGQLTAWTIDELTLLSDEKTFTISASHMLSARWQTDSAPLQSAAPLFLELVDGTRLPHQGYEVQDGQATISTPLAEQPLLLATDQVTFVQLSKEVLAREQLKQQLAGDLLVIHVMKNRTFDYLNGVLGDISSELVVFNWDGEEIPVKRSKVAAIAYFHANKSEATRLPACWLNLHNGARLPASEIALGTQNVVVQTLGDLQFTLALDSIRDVDYSPGKLAYLSDLQPIEQHWTPQIGLPASAKLILQHGLPRRDQSFDGSPLTLRWPTEKLAGELKTYEKGLAIRSRTVCRYRVPQGMSRFVTFAGIDPKTANQGNVTLEIFAGKQSVWQGEIDGSAAPVEINVELGNARELRLVVDYGANLDFGDRLHLTQARLSR